MAEVKRTFHNPGINRDLDDRLVPNGMYRDGLNINVGRSEGDDVGALENLRGNMLITGQGDIVGTTIGTIVDPASDKLYWFTTDDAQDAIYEYDGTTVSTIISDNRFESISLPTCVPVLEAFITGPDSGRPADPVLPAIPPVVNVPAASASTTVAHDAAEPTQSATLTANIIVDGSNTNYSYSWDSGETTQSITVSGTGNVSVTRTVTVTADDGGTAMASGTATFSFTRTAPPPPPSDAVAPTVTINQNPAGDQQVNTDVTLTLTETAGELQGGTPGTFMSRTWTVSPASATSSDLNGESIVVTRPDAGDVSVMISSVWDTGTAVDDHTVTFTAAPPPPQFTTNFTANQPANTSVVNSGNFPSITGTEGTAYSISSIISANSGFEFDGTPSWAVTGGNASPTSGTGATTGNITGTIRAVNNDAVALTWTAATNPVTMSFTMSLSGAGGGLTSASFASATAPTSATGFGFTVTPTSRTGSAANEAAFVSSLIGTIVDFASANEAVSAGDPGYCLGTIGSNLYSIEGTVSKVTTLSGGITTDRITITSITAI